MSGYQDYFVWIALLVVFYLLGMITAVRALWTARTSQSAIAWMISCITLPWLAVPLYWIFGRNRFHGYRLARRSSDARFRDMIGGIREFGLRGKELPEAFRRRYGVFERLASLSFTGGNDLELLIDGAAAFAAIFREIERAEEYILMQFYIIRSDALGRRMRDVLARKAAAGVRVYFLYDWIGCYALSAAYIESLKEAGIDVRAFRTGKWTHQYQVNFRNHRKAVVVDGRWAVTGGVNLGEEYCGRSEQFGCWRDTMVGVRGPAVQEIQLSFVEDWFFITGKMPELNWQPLVSPAGNQNALVLPTGPADELHTCSMMFTQAIHAAEERLWITSPYFVPDNEIIRALQLAALRGVDVRVLIPDRPDQRLVYWASFTYLEELERTGVKFFRYTRGLLHQKVLLVDRDLALVGSANMDNRSFYLSFELTMLVVDEAFGAEVESMLAEDFSFARSAGAADYRAKGLAFHLAARLSRLLSPLL